MKRPTEEIELALQGVEYGECPYCQILINWILHLEQETYGDELESKMNDLNDKMNSIMKLLGLHFVEENG